MSCHFDPNRSDVSGQLTVVLICICPTRSDAEHLSGPLSLVEDCLRKSPLRSRLSSCYGVAGVLRVFGCQPVVGWIVCKHLLPFSSLPLHFVGGFLPCAKGESLLFQRIWPCIEMCWLVFVSSRDFPGFLSCMLKLHSLDCVPSRSRVSLPACLPAFRGAEERPLLHAAAS